MALKFRRARLESPLDRERLLRLQYQLFPSDTPKTLFGEAGSRPPDWWLALRGDEAVAFASLGYTGEGEATLSRCGVVEECRGRGVQLHLIKLRIRRAIAQGVKRLTTYTAKWNTHSANNIKAMGFRKVKSDRNFVDWELALP